MFRKLLLLVFLLLIGTAVVSPLALSASARSKAAIGVLHLYRSYGSPVLSRVGIRCRFRPTCSRYAELAIAKYGVGKGTWLTMKRVARCTPLTPMGTRDVP